MWERLSPEAKASIEDAGWKPPQASSVVIPPPGLGEGDVDMEGSEASEAKQKLWSEASEQQRELMIKAGLKPPEQKPVVPNPYEEGTAANAAYRKATVALKMLGDKKISLQKRIDQAKEQYHARLTEMQQLQTKIDKGVIRILFASQDKPGLFWLGSARPGCSANLTHRLRRNAICKQPAALALSAHHIFTRHVFTLLPVTSVATLQETFRKRSKTRGVFASKAQTNFCKDSFRAFLTSKALKTTGHRKATLSARFLCSARRRSYKLKIAALRC